MAVQSDGERESYLRRLRPLQPELVSNFLDEYEEIRRTRLATNIRRNGTRFAVATTFRNGSGTAIASITLVGPTQDLQPRLRDLGDLLLRRVDECQKRVDRPREAI